MTIHITLTDEQAARYDDDDDHGVHAMILDLIAEALASNPAAEAVEVSHPGGFTVEWRQR
jgi:hypothetical protein